MSSKNTLIVFDFDGLLINSYKLLKITFNHFGLDVGDEDRFKNRRKFLKYVGGGKELIGNLVNLSLPSKKLIREKLTKTYCENGKIHPEFTLLINDLIDNPNIHVGIVSRNFTHHPGNTIRQVLRNSKINEAALDFLIPISAGVKKVNVLEAMKSSAFKTSIFVADEISDFQAAEETNYDVILMASYGFDTKERLIRKGNVPEEVIFESPEKLAKKLEKTLRKLNLV